MRPIAYAAAHPDQEDGLILIVSGGADRDFAQWFGDHISARHHVLPPGSSAPGQRPGQKCYMQSFRPNSPPQVGGFSAGIVAGGNRRFSDWKAVGTPLRAASCAIRYSPVRGRPWLEEKQKAGPVFSTGPALGLRQVVLRTKCVR